MGSTWKRTRATRIRPGIDDLFEDRGETIVDLDESSLKTTSIMAFLETFALGPESLNGGRVTPTMGEILERVKARKPGRCQSGP